MPKILLLILSCISVFSLKSQDKNWTFLYYAAGSNSSETDLLQDVQEMQNGKLSDDYNLVLLIDRIDGHSDDSLALGTNFTDTKLFEIQLGKAFELNGSSELPQLQKNSIYEANMGDAQTLKDFIRFGKKHYPAKHYMLIMRSHGNGTAMCPDIEESKTDRIYPSEMTDVLTNQESVDILGLDVCSMAELENYYQWRPNNGSFSADYVIASAPLSAAWAYDRLFGRLQTNPGDKNLIDDNYFDEGTEKFINPKTVTPKDLAMFFMEEIYDSQRWASWALFDNHKIESIKNKLDDLAKLLALENKEMMFKIIDSSLAYYHNTSNNVEVAQLTSPFLDAYDFFERISKTQWIRKNIALQAEEIILDISDATMASYYGSGYFPETNRFNKNKNGVSIIVPMGYKTYTGTGRSFWAHSSWYSPNDKSNLDNAYGKYQWCQDNATPNNGVVENWFEYLDSIFDVEDGNGGVNGYKY